MQHFDAATFDAISFRLDLDWTVQQLVDIAKLLKNKADASRRIAADILDDSIIPDLAEDDATFRAFDAEAKRLEQQYEAVKAKLFAKDLSRKPESDADVRQAKDEAKQCYDHLVVAKRHAEEFQASVGGALAAREAHRNAMHIAMLEIRELDAWSRHQRALNKLGARPAYDARLRAANALIQAEGNMGRYLANGGSLGANHAGKAELDIAVKHWKEATVAMRRIEARQPMPLPNASEAQKIIASDAFREWYEDGWSVVLVKASEQGVDLTAHKDVWRKARECTAVPSEQDSMPETHEAAPDRDASRQSNVSRKLKQRVQSMTKLAMEGNSATVLGDADVEKIDGAHFVSDAQGREQLSYLVVLRGKALNELRPQSQCACPDAIHNYEQRYSKAKWALNAYDSSNASAEQFGSSKSDSTGVAEEESLHSSADEDDSHLDEMDSDDSNWAAMEDEQGRPGTDPEARAAIRAAWAASDETYRVAEADAEDEEITESGSDDVSEPTVLSKADDSEDSLLQELKAAPCVYPAVQGRPRRYEAVKGSKRRREVLAYLADADDDSDTENEAPNKKTKRQVARKLSFGEANDPDSVSASRGSFGSVPPLPKYSEAAQRKIKVEAFSSDDDASRGEQDKEVIVLSSDEDKGDAKKEEDDEIDVVTID